MLALLKKQRPDMAAVTWRLQREMSGLTEAERSQALSLLQRGRSSDEVQALYDRLRTPVGGETVAQRTATLDTLLQTCHQTGPALEAFNEMVKSLGADFSQSCEAYTALVSMFAAREREPLKTAATLLAQVRALQAEARAASPDLPVTPLPDMLLALTQSLLMGGTAERAFNALRVSEEQRRRAARAEGMGGRVEVSEGEINLGGIRIKRKGSS